MRKLIPFALVAAIVGCSTAPQQPAEMSPKAQQRLAKLLDGKVPGTPQSCLPEYRQEDMIAVDGNTLVFRDSPGRVWVNTPQGDCSLLESGPYALVTRRAGGIGLCRGDIGQVMDTMSGATVGSCVMGDFIPYTRPGA